MTDDTRKILSDLEADRKEGLKRFAEWCELHPDFKEISRIMNLYKSNEHLVEFRKKSIPESILMQALRVFKKSISFKAGISDKKLVRGLTDSRYRFYKYCIDKRIAHNFQNEFLDWGIETSNLWKQVYYSTQDFFENRGYDRTSWETYIKHPSMLEGKKNELEKQSNRATNLMMKGYELVTTHNHNISEEYERNGFEMSLHQRELEIAQIVGSGSVNDEQYCYVYTLECDLFVFYVGIAINPNERLVQHIRGAYSNEAHLFKSKFIQKYRKEVVQKLIFEGTRGECKLFERNYIAKHMPLGNMTAGGEG